MNSFWSGLMGLGSAAMPFLMSDERTKEDIERVGETDGGSPIYKYRYKWGGPMMFGVLAQEEEENNPDAVVTLPSGLKAVNYEMVA